MSGDFRFEDRRRSGHALDKSITGAKAMLQAWSLDPRRFPQDLELSNAVHWYVGR